MASNQTLPEGHLSIFDPLNENRISINPKTKKLYWDGEEIVSRKTIDFTNINKAGAVIFALLAALAAIGTVFDALINLNKEICFIKQGSCKTSDISNSQSNNQFQTLNDNKSVIISGIHFDSNISTLSIDSTTNLDGLAKTLLANKTQHIEIQGHTDSTGSAEHNMVLSKERALNVAQWLISNGIEPERITSVGYGSSKPITDNTTETGKLKNRRVTFIKMLPVN